MSLKRRNEIHISKDDLKKGYTIRSLVRCRRFFSIGEIRKAKDRETGCSLGVKIRIIKISKVKVSKKHRPKMRVDFVLVEDNRKVCVVDVQ